MLSWPSWIPSALRRSPGDPAVVGDDHERLVPLHPKPFEQLDDLASGCLAEIARRLVRQDHLGLPDQRPRDGHALLLAAGWFRGKMVGSLRYSGCVIHVPGTSRMSRYVLSRYPRAPRGWRQGAGSQRGPI
jgi:hypothetical protein